MEKQLANCVWPYVCWESQEFSKRARAHKSKGKSATSAFSKSWEGEGDHLFYSRLHRAYPMPFAISFRVEETAPDKKMKLTGYGFSSSVLVQRKRAQSPFLRRSRRTASLRKCTVTSTSSYDEHRIMIHGALHPEYLPEAWALQRNNHLG